jgi:serine/threonine-protein kinase RsbT
MLMESVDEPARCGVRLVFEDQGPGIGDLDRAMQDGYSTGKGIGLGLPGTRRLAHEFVIETVPGTGTRVVIVMWKR